MSDPHQLDREIREYVEKEPNLRREDRVKYLKAIFEKHFEFNRLEHVVNVRDLDDIISGAKQKYVALNLPLHITRRRIDSSELPHVAMIESIISYFHKNHLLKKSVKFDITS